MESNALILNNINNLTSFWSKLGLHPPTSAENAHYFMSSSWPYRFWFSNDINISKIPDVLLKIPDGYIFPVFDCYYSQQLDLDNSLQNLGFNLLFTQTAMVLKLNDLQPDLDSSLHLITATSINEIKNWVEVASKSFGYEIDLTTIKNVARQTDLKLLLAFQNDLPVATALTYAKDDIMGIHQLGVLPEFRHQGIAKKLMLTILSSCDNTSINHVVLQASDAAKIMYSHLGFVEQFKIRNYQNVNNRTD